MARQNTLLVSFAAMASTALACTLLFAAPARANTPNICDRAAAVVSQETGVPFSILKAISRTETGRTRNGVFEPWPWATNTGGTGRWFETKSAAVQHAQSRLNQGLTNVDIGCFQLNYRWHGHAFSSLEHMFEPIENARYAAAFLTELYDEKGEWMRAVGAYHSRTQEHANRYKRRFSEIHASLGDDPVGHTTGSVSRIRENRFPLLQRSDAQPRLGSLVPLGQSAPGGSLFSQTGEI
ncbi:transglycosylase SLT domain-containing protein [Roseobacter sinensis]|uniref:Transglycosylase SLT domain-containing protein n=1 Tax=Roseobacter sinensis TaxID=2931391 RepID=A0ABT3B8I6_9RHOB|nr:transglycosylase SLT domain-containing protein [Roseobacter sp. WL0113]MCV3269877.1 transglycosylase SLT domain-containing protein [Roseobacter sp. WL0113]